MRRYLQDKTSEVKTAEKGNNCSTFNKKVRKTEKVSGGPDCHMDIERKRCNQNISEGSKFDNRGIKSKAFDKQGKSLM